MIKTQGEIEAAICNGITRFEQEYRGRGPKRIEAYLLDDFIVVRLQGLLTTAEQQLAKCPSEKVRLAQRSANPFDRDGKAAPTSACSGNHWRRGSESAPRHKHSDRRSVRRSDPGRAALLPASEDCRNSIGKGEEVMELASGNG